MIDPVAGSGTTLAAAIELDRRAYGFEIKKNFSYIRKMIKISKGSLESEPVIRLPLRHVLHVAHVAGVALYFELTS